MEWKKENISSAELEKRQKEYMNAALSMMKKSGAQHSLPTDEKPAGQQPAVAVTLTEEASDRLSDTNEVPQTDEEMPDEQPSAEQSSAEQSPAEQPSAEDESDDRTDDAQDDKYGVYTADEIMSGEYTGEGLKKAAEILEEMTRSTEMMKKLANSDDDPDTTDFPDFTGSTPKDGEQFREDEETKDCTAEEK